MDNDTITQQDDASERDPPTELVHANNKEKRRACHCTACCGCTQIERLTGMCGALPRLGALTASLDRASRLRYKNRCVKDTSPTRQSNYKENHVKTKSLQRLKKSNYSSEQGTKFQLESSWKGWLSEAGSSHLSESNDMEFPKYQRHQRTKNPKALYIRQKEHILNLFGTFDDCQKNSVLRDMLTMCDVPQTHMLSLLLEPPHQHCPPNCRDIISWLPQTISLQIFTYLDPKSLCQASQACKLWNQLASEQFLWQRLCKQPKWRLSLSGEQKQLLQHIRPSGAIKWKQVLAERYRLRMNWLRGRCHVRTFEGHSQGISCVQFDDTRIVSGSSDKTIKVWNIRTNTPWSVQTLVGHSGTVRCLHLEGSRLVSGSTDRSIKVWDLSTQQSWSSIACKVTMIGHQETVRCLQVDDDKVISGSYDKTLKIWDMRSGHCRATLRGHDAAVLCVQFDKEKILSGSCDKTIKVWMLTGECLMTLHGHHDAVTCLQFDAKRIVSGSLDCNLKLWCIHTGTCQQTIDWKASEGHTGVMRCLQSDSWRVVSASDDRTLKVWNLDTGERLVTLRNHTDGVTCLQFNDSVIVSGSYDKCVKLWDFSSC